MTDTTPAGIPAVLDDPFARLDGPLAGTTRMRLTVTENRPLTPGMQVVRLTAPELAGFSYRPGQDIMLLVAAEGGRPVRRRYTISGVDPAARHLTLGIVRHADGPGERWVATARPGDQIEGIAPRGKIFPATEAGWHLFAGDHAALPAFFAMAASLPPQAPAALIIEVPAAADEQVLGRDASLTWLHQDGRAAGEPSALVEAAGKAELPPGRGHAYLMGEAKVVLALREVLAGRGLTPDMISAKAYWGRGQGNAPHGEPAKDAAG